MSVLDKSICDYEPSHDSAFSLYLQSMSKKLSTTVRIFNRGEYYTVHADDALLAATDIFCTNSVLRYIGSEKIPSVSLSKLNFEVFARHLLLVKQYRVEIYEQKSKGKQDWTVEYKASPGNLLQLEDVLFSSSHNKSCNAGVLSILYTTKDNNKVIGIALVNLDDQTFTLSEFCDGDSFPNLEAVIVQLGPKECILPTGSGAEFVKLKQVLTRNDLLITERKKTDFFYKDTQDIGRLIRGHLEGNFDTFFSQPEADIKTALSALVGLVNYLELLTCESNDNQFTLKSYESKKFMRLDSPAIKALHIDSFGEQTHTGDTTVISLLDKCKSPLGRRLLTQWVRQPLMDINKIVERQDLVEALLSCIELRHSLGEDHLRRIPDLQRVARKLGRKAANLQDCYRLYQCVQRIPQLCEALGGYDGLHSITIAAAFTTPLQETYGNMIKFQEMLETTLDMERASQGEFFVKPDFDEDLGEIHSKIEEMETNITQLFRKVASDLNLEQGKTIKLESNNQLGYFFRVTLKEEKALRNNKQYETLETNKAGVRFTNSSLKDINCDYLMYKESYSNQQNDIANEIIAIAAGYAEVICELSSIMANLDCIYAFATTAASAPVPYTRPKMMPKDTGIIKLIQCRHPCLEMQDELSFIPNDCIFDKENGKFHIITGPNMGGKSTYLRAVAIAVLMAQIGSYVSCGEAEISIVDSIFTRVGAGDCQLKGASTFMTEMLEISSVIKSATENSLVVIDELGRGTSTYDGFGIAWAVSEHIATEICSYALFATHFHELTELEKQTEIVKNYHVSASTVGDTLTLLYQVNPGPCDRSFGIHVAELAKFPADLINCAKQKAVELENGIMDVSLGEDKLTEIRADKQEGEKLIAEYLHKLAELNLESISDEELENYVAKLKEEIGLKDNHYINHLLQHRDI